jgi:hypothetical protein
MLHLLLTRNKFVMTNSFDIQKKKTHRRGFDLRSERARIIGSPRTFPLETLTFRFWVILEDPDLFTSRVSSFIYARSVFFKLF